MAVDGDADIRSATALLRGGALIAAGAWAALLGVIAADRLTQIGVLLFVAVAGWLLLASLVFVGICVSAGAAITSRRTRRTAPSQFRMAGVLLGTWAAWFALAAFFIASLDS